MTNPLDPHLEAQNQRENQDGRERAERIAASVAARKKLLTMLSDFLRRMEAAGNPGMSIYEKKGFGRSVHAYKVSWSFSDYRRAVWVRPDGSVADYHGKKTQWVPLSSLEIFGVNGQGREVADSVTGTMHSWPPVIWEQHLDRHLDAAGTAMAQMLRAVGAKPISETSAASAPPAAHNRNARKSSDIPTTIHKKGELFGGEKAKNFTETLVTSQQKLVPIHEPAPPISAQRQPGIPKPTPRDPGLNGVTVVDPRWTLDDLAGMHQPKQAVKTLARAFRDPEAARRFGLRPARGVLLWGPPGTGKTTLAHALAHEIGAIVWEVDPAGLWDRYVGDSSKNTQAIFNALRQKRHKPVVLFLDEMDALVGKTAPEAGGGATSERNMVNGLLRRELERTENAIVVGTTNDPDRMDPELLRPGRFDHSIPVPLPSEQERVEIMAALMASHIRDTDNSELYEVGIAEYVGDLVRKMDGWSGAEMAELLRRAAERRFSEWSGDGPVPSITIEDLGVEFDHFGR